MRKIPLLACLLVALLSPPPINPETLRLPADSVASMILGGRSYCLVSDRSRYEWKHGELIPLGGLFSYYAANQLPIEARFAVPEQADRGEVLGGYFQFNDTIDRLEVNLEQLDGDSSITVKGFPVDDVGRTWYFLLGIPSTADSGKYSLNVRGYRGRQYILYLADLEVRYKWFRSEEIAFNQSLSELMNSPDPRKVVEFHELREILASFHSRSLFHTGTFGIPVEATRRTSRFADRRLYSYTDGGSSRSLHNGIDLAAPKGTPVFASGAGRVVLAKERIITGNSVVIEHLPGVFSLYYHLQNIEVQEGQRLSQGQRIGTVGMTGLATGPHLHWELRVSGVAVDPDIFVSRPMIDKTVFSHNIMDQN
jgi:murein DD-endopeptidase MepM/ murein hydrolase activator NlpD